MPYTLNRPIPPNLSPTEHLNNSKSVLQYNMTK